MVLQIFTSITFILFQMHKGHNSHSSFSVSDKTKQKCKTIQPQFDPNYSPLSTITYLFGKKKDYECLYMSNKEPPINCIG